MKTIKDVLCELDSEEIEKAYYRQWPLTIDDLSCKETMTIGEAKHYVSKRFQSFLSTLKTHSIEDATAKFILFASKTVPTEYSNDEMETWLCNMEELSKAENVEAVKTYAYNYTSWGEMMGFYVADTPYTQKHILDLVVDFLLEASNFGYDEGHHDKEVAKLQKIGKNCKETHQFITEDTFVECKQLDSDEETECNSQHEQQYRKAVNEAITFYRCEELKHIKADI